MKEKDMEKRFSYNLTFFSLKDQETRQTGLELKKLLKTFERNVKKILIEES